MELEQTFLIQNITPNISQRLASPKGRGGPRLCTFLQKNEAESPSSDNIASVSPPRFQEMEKMAKGIKELEELEEIEKKIKELIAENEYEEINSDTHTINQTDDWFESLSINDILEIENMTFELIGEFLNNEIHNMASPKFHDHLKNDIIIIIEQQLLELGIYTKSNYEELEYYLFNLCDNFFNTMSNIPPRSYPNSITSQEKDIQNITEKIAVLKNVIQPKQKSEEWYKVRNELLTASNIWKIFASEAQQNSLIYEKCLTTNSNNRFSSGINVNSTLHWGNKYEPLSAMIYEEAFETKIEEFGCIIHPKYPFIGASPDGIITDPNSIRFGRMIEIKNIVNRDITGIPKEEYWIQMQIQMETCDLEECDFIETRFKEYVNREAIYENDGTRGIILYFVHKEINHNNYMNDDGNRMNSQEKNTPHYVYLIFDENHQEKEEIDQWIQEKKEELRDNFSLYETQYWYLDEISVVTVKRNREWFQSVVPRIENTWKIIEKERVEGFEHRNSKKRINKMEVTNDENSTNKIIHNMQSNTNICLIKLDDIELEDDSPE